MERYNPFASEQVGGGGGDENSLAQEPDEHRRPKLTSRYSTSFPDPIFGTETGASTATAAIATDQPGAPSTSSGGASDLQAARARAPNEQAASGSIRSNSVTFIATEPKQAQEAWAPTNSATSSELDETTLRARRLPMRTQPSEAARSSGSFKRAGQVSGPGGGGGAGSSGIGSFLYRATSVTTDRVSGAMRSTFDSLSTQLQQQAAPIASQLNERLASSTGSTLQSAASVTMLATGNGPPEGGQEFLSAPVSLVSRQRVVLVLDALPNQPGGVQCADWPQQFVAHRRALAGLPPLASSGPGASSALSSFFSAQFSSAAASLTSSPMSIGGASSSTLQHDGDLIEQANSNQVSVLANQASCTAAVCVLSTSSNAVSPSKSSGQMEARESACKIVRPEFVVVRQRAWRADQLERLLATVKALEYCAVPLFEPYRVWRTFQDRQLIFARLARVRRRLGKERFPLIPQVYCQTHQDLLNYLASSSQIIALPCLIRAGQFGGKLRCESLQMLRDFATIMASASGGLSCTIEQLLDVKCDLVVQKLGNSLKLFKRVHSAQLQEGFVTDNQKQQQQNQQNKRKHPGTTARYDTADSLTKMSNQEAEGCTASGAQAAVKQAASRQSSLGSGVLSSLISSAGQQVSRRSSQPPAPAPPQQANAGAQFERMQVDGAISQRYRDWIEAINQEFDHELEAFAIKIVVAQNDREYIVGLSDCSMDFLGSNDNQEEDKRKFVELIQSKMNAILPKHSGATVSAQSSLAYQDSQQQRRKSSGGDLEADDESVCLSTASLGGIGGQTAATSQRGFGAGSAGQAYDKRQLSKQFGTIGNEPRSNACGQLNNRSKSVSINQSERSSTFGSSSLSIASERNATAIGLPTAEANEQRQVDFASQRRESEQPIGTGGEQQQANERSLGQSFIDQTSTALSSIQRQSLSFFKRSVADSFSSAGGTPPQSARSAAAAGPADRFAFASGATASDWASGSGGGSSYATARQRGGGAGMKSQSMDSSSMSLTGAESSSRRAQVGAQMPPPKPPPPAAQALINRQSSLASPGQYRASATTSTTKHHHYASNVANATPNSTPVHTRQNTTARSSQSSLVGADVTFDGQAPQSPSSSQTTTQRVVRQNSALSAFEPFDLELRAQQQSSLASRPAADSTMTTSNGFAPMAKEGAGAISAARRGSQTNDSASIKSGDSNCTTGAESTGAAEDTMNNLKKTFASIFGDKCE